MYHGGKETAGSCGSGSISADPGSGAEYYKSGDSGATAGAEWSAGHGRNVILLAKIYKTKTGKEKGDRLNEENDEYHDGQGKRYGHQG